MSHARTILRSFAGGELSPEMVSRFDDVRVQNGCRLARNFVISPRGPAQARPGQEFVARTKDSGAKASRCIAFEISSTQGIAVEMGPLYFRFHSFGAPVRHVTGRLVTSVDTTNDRLTFAGEHGFAANALIRVVAMQGSSEPGGVSSLTSYFALVVDPRTIQISLTSGGSAVDLTSAGSGSIRVFDAAPFPNIYVASQIASAIDVSGGNEHIDFAGVHNLQTGDSILFSGTGTTAIGLTIGQEYFAIRISTTRIRVATTVANAQAGTAINLTGVADPPNTRMHRNYDEGDLVYFFGSGEGFYYCRGRPGISDINPPPSSASFYLMPEDGTLEIPSPFTESQLFDVTFDQSFDVMTMCHPDQQVTELRRLDFTRWQVKGVTLAPPLSAPTGVVANATSRGVTWTPPQGRVVAAAGGQLVVEFNNIEEPHRLPEGAIVSVSGAVFSGLTVVPDGFYVVDQAGADRIRLLFVSTGKYVLGNNVGDTYTANSATIRETSLSSDTSNDYRITAIDSDGNESAASSTASVTNDLGVEGAFNTVTWAAVTGASRYRVYKKRNGHFGPIGDVDAGSLSFKDENVGPDLKVSLPIFDTSLSGSDHPGAVGRFDQRRIFAGSNSFPQDVWGTKTGTESDLSFSIPIIDSDRLQFRVDARRRSRIRHVVPTNHLMLLASDAEYRVTPLNSDVITPTSVAVRPQSFVGCNAVRPLTVNGTIVFGGARGGHVYELGFQSTANGFVAADLCLRSAHLFDGFDTRDAARMSSPHPILWWVSSSGKLLGLTYVPEEGVGAWHQHESDCVYESVCVVAEDDEDRLYMIVRRVIDGVTVRNLERLGLLVQPDLLEDCNFLDASLTFDGRNTTATQVKASNGRSWGAGDIVALTATAPLFRVAGGSDVGDEIVLTDASGTRHRCAITSVTSATTAMARLDSKVPPSLRDTFVTTWGFARNQISGLESLNGETVRVVAEGRVLPDAVVANGSITLASPKLVVHIGKHHAPEIQPMPLLMNVDGFGQGRAKNIAKVAARVFRSSPFQMGPSARNLTTFGAAELVDTASTQVRDITLGEWTEDGDLTIRQSEPLPLTITGLVLEVAGGD